jgi:MerR family transcriptional regulator/heat shock protein HspR
MHNYDEPVYLISVVSKVLNIHPQTLRQYEREGLITPSRTDGRIRLYSQRNMDKIKFILRLTRELGVNLAGVDIILRLRGKMDELENEIDVLKLKINTFSDRPNMVSSDKSLVTTRQSSYEIIIFQD